MTAPPSQWKPLNSALSPKISPSFHTIEHGETFSLPTNAPVIKIRAYKSDGYFNWYLKNTHGDIIHPRRLDFPTGSANTVNLIRLESGFNIFTMPPPSNSAALHLLVLPEPFFVVKLSPGQEIAPCIVKDLTEGKGGFFSVTRTQDEVSIVGEAYKWMPASYKEQSTWMCIKIQGPMEHSLTGIMAALTTPLKAAKVPVFAMSTWNTDYVLVPTEMLSEAIRALERDGWLFVQGLKGSRMARL